MTGDDEGADEQAEETAGARSDCSDFVEGVFANDGDDLGTLNFRGADVGGCGVDDGSFVDEVLSRDEGDLEGLHGAERIRARRFGVAGLGRGEGGNWIGTVGR
jgi:hypothetical protein